MHVGTRLQKSTVGSVHHMELLVLLEVSNSGLLEVVTVVEVDTGCSFPLPGQDWEVRDS
jgi:hypothetical protein